MSVQPSDRVLEAAHQVSSMMGNYAVSVSFGIKRHKFRVSPPLDHVDKTPDEKEDNTAQSTPSLTDQLKSVTITNGDESTKENKQKSKCKHAPKRAKDKTINTMKPSGRVQLYPDPTDMGAYLRHQQVRGYDSGIVEKHLSDTTSPSSSQTSPPPPISKEVTEASRTSPRVNDQVQGAHPTLQFGGHGFQMNSLHNSNQMQYQYANQGQSQYNVPTQTPIGPGTGFNHLNTQPQPASQPQPQYAVGNVNGHLHPPQPNIAFGGALASSTTAPAPNSAHHAFTNQNANNIQTFFASPPHPHPHLNPHPHPPSQSYLQNHSHKPYSYPLSTNPTSNPTSNPPPYSKFQFQPSSYSHSQNAGYTNQSQFSTPGSVYVTPTNARPTADYRPVGLTSTHNSGPSNGTSIPSATYTPINQSPMPNVGYLPGQPTSQQTSNNRPPNLARPQQCPNVAPPMSDLLIPPTAAQPPTQLVTDGCFTCAAHPQSASNGAIPELVMPPAPYTGGVGPHQPVNGGNQPFQWSSSNSQYQAGSNIYSYRLNGFTPQQQQQQQQQQIPTGYYPEPSIMFRSDWKPKDISRRKALETFKDFDNCASSSEAILVPSSGFQSRPQGRRRAVLVGCQYKILTHVKGDLRGCTNDVALLHEILTTEFGFKSDDIVIMTDIFPGDYVRIKDTRTLVETRVRHKAATKENIIGELKDMTENATSSDRLWFSFSGHGRQIKDENNDERDGFDEVLLTGDLENIVDDDLFEIITKIPAGARLTGLIDACNSGTVFDLPFVASKNFSWIMNVKEIDLDVNLAQRVKQQSELKGTGHRPGLKVLGADAQKSSWCKLKHSDIDVNTEKAIEKTRKCGLIIQIGGTRDGFVAENTPFAQNGEYYGAFTLAFGQAIHLAPRCPNTNRLSCSYYQLLSFIFYRIKEWRKAQQPQFSCSDLNFKLGEVFDI